MSRMGEFGQPHGRGAAATGRYQPSSLAWRDKPANAVRGVRFAILPAILGGALLTGSAGAATQMPDATASAAPHNAFHEQAARLGVRQCANFFAALGQSATNGATYAVQVRADRAAPDAHAVIGVAGSTYNTPQYSGQAAAIALAAPVGSACEGQMVRVAPFQRPCPEVARELPSGSTVAATLSGLPLYNLGGNQGQALLLTSGATCVVVTIAAAIAPG